MKNLTVVCFAGLIISSASITAQISTLQNNEPAHENSDLLKIDLNYASAIVEAQRPLSELKVHFRQALLKYQIEAQKKGNLDGVLAAKSCIAMIDEEKTITVDLSDIGISNLQKAYLEKFSALSKEEKRKLSLAKRIRAESLEKMAVTLTKAGKIEEAIEARNEARRHHSVVQGKIEPEPQISNPLNPEKIGTELWAKESIFRSPEKIDKATATGCWIGRGKYFLDLEFGNEKIALSKARTATLVFRVGTDAYSGTPARIEIICDRKIVGSAQGAARGQIVSIPLDLKALASARNFNLTVTVHGELLEITAINGVPDIMILLKQ